MGFSRQEYWSGLPFSSPGDLPNSGTEPTSPELAGGFLTMAPPGKPHACDAMSQKMSVEWLQGLQVSLRSLLFSCGVRRGKVTFPWTVDRGHSS